MIVATRQVDVACEMCDRIAVLSGGQLIAQGPAGQVARHAAGQGWWEIRVQGHLAGTWSDWFDGLSVTPERGGILLLAGPVVDQAALHGVLDRLRDLGLRLVSVKRSALDLGALLDELRVSVNGL